MESANQGVDQIRAEEKSRNGRRQCVGQQGPRPSRPSQRAGKGGEGVERQSEQAVREAENTSVVSIEQRATFAFSHAADGGNQARIRAHTAILDQRKVQAVGKAGGRKQDYQCTEDRVSRHQKATRTELARIDFRGPAALKAGLPPLGGKGGSP